MGHRHGRRTVRAVGVLLGTLTVAGLLGVAVASAAPATGKTARVVADDGSSDCSDGTGVCVPGWKDQIDPDG
ncbi:MAG TPA: hypothetical protein VJT31_39745 [Rugosimonospora sp.]|nr:hypothetical protein [Rugosimonospora sp.]